MEYTVETIEPPPHEPVTAEHVRRHCRVEEGEHDQTLSLLTTAATQAVESESRRKLVPQVLRVEMHSKRVGRPIELPFTPAIELIEMEIGGEPIDLEGVRFEASAGRIWGSGLSIRPSHHVSITYRAGYGVRFAAVGDWIFPDRRMFRIGHSIQVSGPGLPAQLSDQTGYFVTERAADGAIRIGKAPGDDSISIPDSDATHWITSTPPGLQAACLMLIGHWLEHPEAMGSLQEAPWAISRLIEQHRPGDDFSWRV